MSEMFVTKRNGETQPFLLNKINDICKYVCRDLSDVDPGLLASEVSKQVYPGIHTDTIYEIIVLTARTMMVNDDPNYSYVAARTLLLKLNREVVGRSIKDSEKDGLYRQAFIDNVHLMVQEGLLSDKLLDFDLPDLAAYLKIERDQIIKYPGIVTLHNNNLIHKQGRRLESLQGFFMRVAMGLSLNEEDKNAWAKRFYDKFSLFKYTPSSPTLFNSGTPRSQLSSCYLSTIPDDLESIFGGFHSQANLSKWAGGLANDFTDIRAIGAWIKKTNGPSAGLMPWLKIYNDEVLAVNQGSKRKGSGVAYLEFWHFEIEEFLGAKKNTGDERRLLHDINTANWIPDLFFERLVADGAWTLFSPDEVPDLHTLIGEAFKKRYEEYESLAKEGKIKLFRTIQAKSLWRKALTAILETGHPWICFKDPCNIRYPNQHVGVVRSSNLCCIAATGRVATDKGIFTIKELYYEAQKPRYDLPPKNTVVGREKFETASPMLMPRPNAPMVKICTEEGFEHKVTPDHPIWVKNQGWVEAQNIKVGSIILGQQIPGGWGTEINAGQACEDARKLRGQYITEKHVPDYLWKSNKHTVKTYLDNLFWHPAPVWGLAYAKHKSFFQDLQILLANFGLIYEIKDFINPMVFVGYSLQRKRNNELTFSHLEELPNEDAYCLEVESDEHSWTVDGLITKNTEITLHTTPTFWEEEAITELGETAVCSLAALNSMAHLDENDNLNLDEVADTIYVMARGLDNSIDLNYYPTRASKNSHLKHRPIGLGHLGWASFLQRKGIPYDSEEALLLAEKVQEFFSYNAIKASCQLAKERGKYSTYDGSEWSKGNLPIDTYINLMKYRDSSYSKTAGDFETLDWDSLRKDIKKYGVRNSNLTTQMPNATTATVLGVSQSHDPTYSVLYTYSTLNGELPMINEEFVLKAKKLGLWGKSLIKKLKQCDGDIANLHSLPQDLRDVFKTAFNVDQHKLIDIAAARQRWICQAMSTNLFYDGKSLKKLSEIYLHAWRSGLKTTYYLRSKGASRMEKVTLEANNPEKNAVGLTDGALACSIEAARNGGTCESCQ